MLTPDDAPLLQMFASVVRLGGFSAAARAHHLSKSVVSERIALLEERCGVRLLERTTRRMRLTTAGQEVLETSQHLQETLHQLSLVLEEAQREPSGTLRIATTHDLGALLLAPTVARFVQTFPKVVVDLTSDDSRKDLLEAEIDVAVRIGVPDSTSFIMRRLAVLEEPIVAAPALAQALGPVSAPSALASAPWVCHRLFANRTLEFESLAGEVDEVHPWIRVQADSGATLVALLLSGAGVGMMPAHALYDPLREGRLVRLCPDWIWKRVSIYSLIPSRAFQRPVVKAFLTMLGEQLAAEPGRWGRVGAGGSQVEVPLD